MGNEALYTNRNVFQHADIEITTHGSDWLFTVCAIMGASTIAVMAHSFSRPHNERLFHQITAALLFVAAIAYFTMGSNLGQVAIQAEFVRPGDPHVGKAGTREIFYVRYIDWFITTPLLLADLLLTAGLPWSIIMSAIIADEIMIVCGLVGALVSTRYKWGYWTFGNIAFFYVVYTLLFTGRTSARILGGWAKKTYYTCGILMVFIWFLYPIAWGVCEGGNVISPDSEAIFYGILDVLAKPVFSALLIYGHTKIEFRTLGINVPQPGYPHVRDMEKNYGNGGYNNGSHAPSHPHATGSTDPTAP